MHDILKLLNDRSASDLAEFDDDELEKIRGAVRELCERSPRLNVAVASHFPGQRPAPSDTHVAQPR